MEWMMGGSFISNDLNMLRICGVGLLKSLKYPELSYRKYCSAQLSHLERKTNRAFVGLPSMSLT